MIARLIGLAFGCLWLLVGASAAGAAAVPVAIVGIILFMAAAWRTVRRDRHEKGPFAVGYYIAAVVAEVVAIMIAQAWLSSRGLNALLFPVIGIIVGLHFIGLWLAMRHRRFLWLTAGLVAINLTALILPLSRNERLMVSGFGSSAALIAAVSA